MSNDTNLPSLPSQKYCCKCGSPMALGLPYIIGYDRDTGDAFFERKHICPRATTILGWFNPFWIHSEFTYRKYAIDSKWEEIIDDDW